MTGDNQHAAFASFDKKEQRLTSKDSHDLLGHLDQAAIIIEKEMAR